MEEIIPKVSTDVDEMIDSHIQHIRRMATLTDDQLRILFRNAVTERPELLETFKEATRKKTIQDMNKLAKEMSKDVQGDPTKFARKVA